MSGLLPQSEEVGKIRFRRTFSAVVPLCGISFLGRVHPLSAQWIHPKERVPGATTAPGGRLNSISEYENNRMLADFLSEIFNIGCICIAALSFKSCVRCECVEKTKETQKASATTSLSSQRFICFSRVLPFVCLFCQASPFSCRRI